MTKIIGALWTLFMTTVMGIIFWGLYVNVPFVERATDKTFSTLEETLPGPVKLVKSTAKKVGITKQPKSVIKELSDYSVHKVKDMPEKMEQFGKDAFVYLGKKFLDTIINPLTVAIFVGAIFIMVAPAGVPARFWQALREAAFNRPIVQQPSQQL